MLNIVKNELFKVFAKKKVYIFMAILFVLSVLPCVASLILKNGAEITGQMLAISQLTMLTDLLIPIFITILISDLYTEEYADGTLKLQLMHPVSRGKLLSSKMITLAMTIMILLIFSMISGYIVGTAFFGWGDQFAIDDVAYSTGSGILLTFGSYMVSVIPMISFGAFVLLITLQFTSGGAAVGTSIGVFIILTYTSQFIEEAKPFIINNFFDVFYLFINNSEIKNIVNAFTVIAIYGIGSYIISSFIFHRKEILY